MPTVPFKFSATLREVSNIELWIEAESEEAAREAITKRDFSWNEEVKQGDYELSFITNVTLMAVDGELVKGEK